MTGDWCDETGARKLAERIEAYWAQRGEKVTISLVPGPFTPAMRSGRMDIRSNMRDGRPIRKTKPY